MAKKEEVKEVVVGSPEWRAAKREGKKALDEKLGTGRVVRNRDESIKQSRPVWGL